MKTIKLTLAAIAVSLPLVSSAFAGGTLIGETDKYLVYKYTFTTVNGQATSIVYEQKPAMTTTATTARAARTHSTRF